MNLKAVAFIFPLLISFLSHAQDFSPKPDTIKFSSKRNFIRQKSDTIRALKNLFSRKRKAATWRVAAVVGLADIVIIRMWSNQSVLTTSPSTPMIIPPTPQFAPRSSSISTVSYFFLGLTSLIAFKIIWHSLYEDRPLKELLNDYNTGKKLSPKVVRKLKEKDFQ